MIVTALVAALVFAAGCNLYLFACWWRATLERDRALQLVRESMAAMEIACSLAADAPGEQGV